MLRVEGVGKRFEGSDSWVLRDVDLVVPPGRSVAIVGPSGCGKSSLLHILGTLDRPTEGRVLFGDIDAARLDDMDLASLRRHNLGFVFQDHHLLPHLTALENVLLPTLSGSGWRPDSVHVARSRELLGRLDLSERLSFLPGQLSTGQRQRVAVARALVTAPKLILADEPTGALDAATGSTLVDLLLENRGDAMLVVVTHSASLAARLDEVYELRDGLLVERA